MTESQTRAAPLLPETDITAPSYAAARSCPTPDQAFYLHLTDLQAALESHRTKEAINVLDFGCGGSPYRELFPNAMYRRADLVGTGDLDFVITPQGISAADSTFDLVLSTQVLEHVEDPAAYLHECFRVLCPGGKLLLSTHGTYEDHGCPADYWRWTDAGLRKAVLNAGFRVDELMKITTSGRAMAFLITRHLQRMRTRDGSVFGVGFRILPRVLRRWRTAFHRWCDRQFANNRVVSAKETGHEIYIALLVVARKPAES